MGSYKNRYVIVRGAESGVFAGVLKEKEGREVELTDCRRLWYWEGAATLSQLAVDGTQRPCDCSFTMSVEGLVILDAIEIIPCSEKAEKSIRSVDVWKYVRRSKNS